MNDNDYIFYICSLIISVLICSNSLLSIFLHRYYLYVSSSTSGASQLWTHWPSALLFCIARTMPFIWLNFCPRSWTLWPVTSVRRTAISHALHAQHCDLGMSWEAIHAACRLQSLIYNTYISLDDIPGFAPGGIGGKKHENTVLDFTVYSC